MKQTVLVLLSIVTCLTTQAQTWNEGYINQPANIRYASHNPTRIAYNVQRDFAVANVNYSLSKGDFHAVDASGDAHAREAYIGGLRHIGKFDVQGHISYRNQKDNDLAWSAMPWNNPDNPFAICDSVPGDATTESYDMQASATYSFSDRLKGAVEIGLRTGNKADQTDPRPRTVTSILPITLGADYRLTDNWSAGVSAGVRFFSSLVEYTNVNSTLHSHRYFLMKGMGDYAKRSSGDESGYKRDFSGHALSAALQAVWHPRDGQTENFTEISVKLENEDAIDGGESYSFHGGDYKETLIALTDRFLWRANENTRHNFSLSAAYTSGKGNWYDQKRELDTELNSAIFYRILNESTIQKTQRLSAGLGYRLDLLKGGQRNIFVDAGARLNYFTQKHFQGSSTPTQKIQTIDLSLEAGKSIYISKVVLQTALGGTYRLPGTKEYANGSAFTGEDDISRPYTRRIFEYESASRLGIHALADVSLPATERLTAGAYINGRLHLYTDNQEYWTGYDGTSLTTVEAGFYLKF